MSFYGTLCTCFELHTVSVTMLTAHSRGLYVDILSGTRRVHANEVYQQYIKDKDHYHMNATRVSQDTYPSDKRCLSTFLFLTPVVGDTDRVCDVSR